MKKLYTFLFLGLVAFTARSGIVVNPGFEDGFKGWRHGGKAKLTWNINDKIFHSGKKSLYVRNDSKTAPNVFGTISQTLNVKPDTKYQFSLWIKAENAKNIWFMGGRGWNIRKFCPNGTYDWKKISINYKTKKNENKFQFRINFDGKCKDVWIDDIDAKELTTGNNSNEKLVSAAKGVQVSSELTGVSRYFKTAEKLKSKKLFDAYAKMRYLVIKKFNSQVTGNFYRIFPNLKGYAQKEVEQMAKEEMQRLQNIEAGKNKLVAVPVRAKDEYPQFVKEHLEQTVVWPDGKKEKRPMFLFGFGHFQGMRWDIGFLASMGVNYSQTEIGPRHVKPSGPELKPDGRAPASIKKFINQAEKYGVLVDLLISPHYMPKWFLEKNPDAKVLLGGFLRYGINRPAVKKFIGETSNEMINLMKNKALYSVCLINEPVAFIWHKDKDTKPMWEAYLKAKYKTISKLNRKWNRKYKHFADISPVWAPPKVPFEFDPKLYDWQDFNAWRLADWISWLDGAIKPSKEGRATHAKMMSRCYSQYDLMQGVDVYYFSKLGQFFGCDGGTTQRGKNTNYYSMLVKQSMMRGAQPKPINNTEFHLLRDRNHDAVHKGHVRVAYLSQALSGLCASAAWNWDWDGANKNTIFAGLFRYRPQATEEYMRTSFDLMRLAPEAVAVSEKQPKIGIIYSRGNMLWKPGTENVLSKCYQAVSELGENAVIIPEQHLASGKYQEMFPELRTLILPDIKYLTDEAYTAVVNFSKQGYHDNKGIILLGDSIPDMDPYGNKRNVNFLDDSAVIAETVAENDITAEKLKMKLDTFNALPEISLMTFDNKQVERIFWRTAKLSGKDIVTAINFTDKPIKLQWKKDNKVLTFQDQLSLNPSAGETVFELPPYSAVLGYLK